MLISNLTAAWFDSTPIVIVDCATFALAALGGYVAVSPPDTEEKTLKFAYVCSFVALALIGIGANIWQRSIDRARQLQLEQNETQARKEFKEDLEVVKESTNQTEKDVRYFINHPPKGYTPEQTLLAVQTFFNNRAKQASISAAAPPPPVTSLGRPPAIQPDPVILSVPNSFEDGTITGKNLALGMADLLIQLRVKPSAATGDYRDEGLAGRDRLLGDQRATNLVAVPKDCIQQWSDSSINLRFTRNFWPSVLERVKREAQNRRIAPLNESDIEVCYQIKVPDEPLTEQVCPK